MIPALLETTTHDFPLATRSQHLSWEGETVDSYVEPGVCFFNKVETPIHDNIRELITWECKEHGLKSCMC